MSTISASTTSTTAFKITTDTTGALVFQTGATPTTAVTMDANQNMGLGVTPTAYAGARSLNVAGFNGLYALTAGTSGGDYGLIGYNIGFTSTTGSYKYQVGDTASALRFGAGGFQFYSAVSGTAGNAITFTQAMTLDASGRLVVNGTSPNSTTVLTLQESSSLSSAIAFKNRNSTQTWAFAVDTLAVDDKALGFLDVTNNVMRMTLDTSGNLLVGVTTTTSGGGVLQLSSGITFPATQVASSNVNTLDDYEEGTFTPVLQGTSTNPTATYGANNQGHYVKVGKMVTFRMNVYATSISGGSGTLLIGGLPFASTTYWTAVNRGYSDTASDSSPNALMIINGGTSVYTWQNASTSVTSDTSGNYTTTSAGSSIDMYISGSYFAA